MIKELPYAKKFELLNDWHNEIFALIKKEIKQDHLRKEIAFAQKHFSKKAIDKIALEEIVAAYVKEIADGNEEVGEWVASRWVIKHGEIYHLFAQRLAEVNPKFDQIEQIPQKLAQELIAQCTAQYGAKATYIFSVLNSVVFSESDYALLRKLAGEEVSAKSAPAVEEESVEIVKERYENELRKLKDKYEKKVLGLEQKYVRDTEGLRKQIGQLQKRMGELSRV